MDAKNGSSPQHRGSDGEARKVCSRPSSPSSHATAAHRRRKVLTEPVVVTRLDHHHGQVILLVLRPLGSSNLVDIRTVVPNRRAPLSEFTGTVDLLPRLAREFAKAERMARDLGLLD